MTLKELEIGDIFYNEKDKQKKLFIVRGRSIFNVHAGFPTRVCMNMKKKELIRKSCKINVICKGKSRFSKSYKLKPINFIQYEPI